MAKKKDFYGLTEDDYNEFRKYRASTENVQNLMSQAEKERHYLENDNLSIMERNRALYNHRITLNQLSEVSGAGVSVPGLNSGYMSQLQEQYTRALNRLDNDIKANRLDFGGLGMQTAAGFAPNGTQFDREPLSQHLKPGRGLIDFNTGYPTESNQRAAQENAMRTQYQNIQTEAGQEAARWGQQNAMDMDELEQTTYWLDILRGLPKSQDPGVVKNNNDLVAQIAAEAGITNYADADDLSAQLSVRESQLRAKSYWSERMAGRSAGQQRAAWAYEYQLDNPNESLDANYYLAMRDQAARDIQNVDSFADYFDTKGAVGDWLRYNSAYGDQLYQDQKNEEILAIRSDPNVGPIYQEAMEASRGAGEVANLRAQAHGEMRETGSISAQTAAAIRELAARYGITVGQGDAALEAALEQMHQQNSRNVNVSMARLQAQGYDPKRLRQYIQQALNEERMDAKNAEAREFANEHPVAATLGSSLTNVLSGGGYISAAPQAIGNAISGVTGNYDNYIPIDTNSVGFDQAQYVMAVRDEVTKNIQENGGNDLLYGVGTSILDNMVQMAVGTALMGGAGAVTGQGARAAIQSGMQSAATASLATMGLSAASQELVRLTEQGVSSDQAFALATIRGAVEIVTEKIGIDNFISNLGKKSAGNFVQQIVGMAVQQSAAEGGEEIIAEVAGLYADWLIRQEESDIAKTIEAGRLNGMTESEALWDAFEKYALQVLEAGVAGALSGLFFGAMSTAGMVVDAVSPAATGARIRAEGNEPVLGMMASAYGLEYDESMTDRQIGKVYREVQKQADRVTKDMQYGISMESYAQEKGYDTKTAKALSRSWNAYRTVDGNNMSSREFAATWNSVKAAGQANMSFDNAVAELGETTLSRYTLESAWKAGQRLYAQAQKTAKAQPVKAQETVQQENVPEVKLDTEIGEGVPAQTELVQRTSEKAATYAQQLMGERINVNGLSDDVVESFYDEIDSDIATERQGALAMARMLTGVSKNISQVIFVDSASYDAEGRARPMSNGMWDPTNRTMTIDINAGRMNVEQQMTFMTRAMSHEITHSIKTTAREQYDELSRFVLREMDKQHNLEALIEAKIKDYASEGIELDREGAIDELVAEACEQMLERTYVLKRLARENRSLWEKIRDFFKDAIEKLRNLYKGLSPNSTEAKLMQGVINELQAKWDAAFAASLTAEVTETSAAAQHSIAGRNAAIADIVSMENAVRMEEAGHTAPEIYNDTGWFRGADNMWRFEIDDSTMRYTPERMAQKMTDGAAHLEDVIDHPVLFEAYPQLRDVSVTFSPMKPGSQGVYRRTENRIYLADSIKNSPEATLVHEIQHAIQAMEGFAFGASRAYWKKIIDNGGKIDSKRLRDATAAVRKFEGSQGNKEIVDARNRLNSAWEEGAKAGAAMYAQLENEGIAEKVDVYEDMLWEQSNAGVAFLNSTPMELYQNTAGEQEARDVSERRTMTSEQRKGKMPQTGTKDTVFAEGSSASASDSAMKPSKEIQFSLARDEELSALAKTQNNSSKAVPASILSEATRVRQIIANMMRENISKYGNSYGLPPDIEGNTFLGDGAYGGSEENTTICVRSMAHEAMLDAVSEMLGRPLTVQESIFVGQDLMRLTDVRIKNECSYCYVATDRKGYREFLGKYLEQRDEVLNKYRKGNTDISKLYKSFIGKRKGTNEMWSRFYLWVASERYMNGETDISRDGELYREYLAGWDMKANAKTPVKEADVWGKFDAWMQGIAKNGSLIRPHDLANVAKLIREDYDEALAPQIEDAMKYAQAASWAKKRMSYTAYNGHILKWTADRIKALNSHYGLRMYSFSDFSPAFILENMQMFVDAAVRGLKVLAYTKELDFVKIFAKTGANINISCFGMEVNGVIAEDSIQGAAWAEAQKLREENPNVGITFVATNDALVEWALAQEWIDVVIPFHLVRTGKELAKQLGFEDYTKESADKKVRGKHISQKKAAAMGIEADESSISPVEHDNDFDKYMAALEKNHLKPRFERWIKNPNYMKLVNECRQSASETKPVQPVFDLEAAKTSLNSLIGQGGYYVPYGKSIERQYEIADEIADKISAGEADAAAKQAQIEWDEKHPKKPSKSKKQHQISRDTASSMDLLMGASMDGLSKAEADHLLRYRDRVNEIRQNQRKIDELKAEELTADINAQIKLLENANSIIYRKVNAAEQTDLMQRIIERERTAGDIEVQRMDNRVADLEDEIDELEQKIRNAKLAGQMGQGRRDAATLRKTEERLTSRNEKQKQRAAEKLSKQKQKTEEQKQKYTEAKQEHRDAVAEYKQKLKAKQNELNRVREKRDERIAQMQESRVKSMDDRHRTQMRHKILKVVKELDSLLLRGTKDRNIRDEMKAAVASALEAVNMEAVDYAGRIAKIDKAIAEAANTVVIEELGMARERLVKQASSMNDRLTAMQTAYAKYSMDVSGVYQSSYDIIVQNYINATIEKVGDTPLWDMTVEQLDSVYNMYKMILTDIQQANKLVRDEKNRTIYSMGNSVIRELDDKKRKELTLEILEKLKQFGWDNLKAISVMEAIGSNTLLELYENVRNGEDTWARDVSEAHKFYEDTAEKYNVGAWDLDETHRFASRSGKEFRLSLEQIMSLYAYSKRNQAEDHLQKGGFVFDSAIERYKTKDSEDGKKRRSVFKYRVKTKQAYAIDPLTLNDIIATLTDEQRNFVDEMQAYLSDTMGAKGNEVSLDMYGVRLFNEQNYFPLKTALQFLFEQNEVAGEVKLKNSGFSKHTKPHASNPVILSNFMDVWGRHVNDMSMYHAFVIPLENFNRVYNYQTLTTNEAEPDSVKGTLADIYGDAPVNYIKQMLTDLNGGARVDRTASVIDWGLSKFKSAAVMASASVVIQQISAVARAAAYIDPQYFLSRNKMSHRDAWEELKAHAPVAIIKEMGRFDVNMGKATSDWITDKKQTGLRRVGEVADDFFSRAPAFMDEVGWLRIWAAVKKEAEKQTNLKPGTQEFLEHCGKRFTYIIERSQVYDSVLSRSATMRSKDTGMKMATAFMAEPITSMNMLVQAYSNFFRKGYRRAAARTVGAVAVSSILNSILVSIVLAARDDDEDETYAEKYFQALSERLKGNAFDLALVNMVPFLRDIISIFQGYDVSRTDMSMVVDFYKAYQTIVSDTASTYDKVKTVTGELARLFGLPVKNLWRDAEGIYNVVKGYLENEGLWTPGNAWGDIREGLYEGFTGKTISSGQKLYEAYMSGDGGKIFVLEAEYQDAYGEDWYKQIQSDLRTHVKGLYLDGDLSYDDAMLFLMRYAIELTPSEERQHEAGTISDEEYTKLLEDAAYWTIKGWDSKAEDSDASTAKYADLQAVIEAGGDGTAAIEELLEHGETEKEIRSGASDIIADLYKNGEIDADTAEEYLAEYAGITDSKDLYTWFTEKDHWVETGESDYGPYGPVWDALIEGGDVNGAIDAMVDAGWTEAAIADNIRTKTKEWVLGTASDGYVIGTDEARDILSKYGGVDSDDLDMYIDWYTFQMNNPDYASEFSMEAVQKYNEFGTGVDLDVYAEFMEETGSMEADINPTTGKAISGSKKAKVMDYINAMPISDSQKDQLYYAAGYKQSTIYEAPWH